jgi:hypothetical protein
LRYAAASSTADSKTSGNVAPQKRRQPREPLTILSCGRRKIVAARPGEPTRFSRTALPPASPNFRMHLMPKRTEAS